MFQLPQRYFIVFIVNILFLGCSQIQPHPDIWKSKRVKKHSVEKTMIVFEKQIPEEKIEAPSVALSEWSLLSKTSFALREYKLVLRDQSGNLVESHNAPEIKIDGPAKLIDVNKMSPATWKIALEYFYDPVIVNIGFQLGPFNIDHFRQIHYQMHDIDFMESKSFTQKSRIRADGEDKLRVYVHMKDKRGYNIFSTTDFKINLIVDQSNAKVSGPFSATGGPYFEVSSTAQGFLRYAVEIDGQHIKGHGEAHFVAYDLRGPAAENGDCLKDLAVVANQSIPKLEPLDAYQELVTKIIKLFEEQNDSSLERYQFIMDTFSSPSCTSHKLWDAAREEAGRELRQIHRRISR